MDEGLKLGQLTYMLRGASFQLHPTKLIWKLLLLFQESTNLDI